MEVGQGQNWGCIAKGGKKIPHLHRLIKFTKEVSDYGSFWEGLGFAEDTGRVVFVVFSFLKKLFNVRNSSFES
jgi:hypothetical protein